MVVINVDQIMNRALRAWNQTIDQVNPAMQAAIERNIYPWDGVTVRSNGDTVGSPRDIVDTGALLEAQGIERISIETARIFNRARHAIAVHEGTGRTRSRRWTRKAIRGSRQAAEGWRDPQATLNIPEFFADAFRSSGSR